MERTVLDPADSEISYTEVFMSFLYLSFSSLFGSHLTLKLFNIKKNYHYDIVICLTMAFGGGSASVSEEESFFHAVSGVENNRRQKHVEEDFRIESRNRLLGSLCWLAAHSPIHSSLGKIWI